MYAPLVAIAEWIVGDGRPKQLWPRFGAFVAATFLYWLVMDWKDGDLTDFWWGGAAVFSSFVGVAFGLWRFVEQRRREQRRRAKAVASIDLG